MGTAGSETVRGKLMRRREEVPFGSDSFLDVLSNLVGIILILVVLVVARIWEWPGSFSGDHAKEMPEASPLSGLQSAQEPSPVEAELIGALLRDWESAQARSQLLHEQLEGVSQKLGAELQRSEALQHDWQHHLEAWNRLNHEIDRERREKEALQEEVRALEWRVQQIEQQRSELARQTARQEVRALHYWMPVSRPVVTEEVYFECRENRVTPIDLAGLFHEVREQLPAHVEQLRYRWSVEGETSRRGDFVMKYRVARRADSPLDWLFRDQGPAEPRYFSAGLVFWELVPAKESRGETLEQALAEQSNFRRWLSQTSPERVVVTFFVYPESIPLYRALRDWVYQHGYAVAARPLPAGMPIMGSPSGSRSRAQ